jgi:hypothetical protein
MRKNQALLAALAAILVAVTLAAPIDVDRSPADFEVKDTSTNAPHISELDTKKIALEIGTEPARGSSDSPDDSIDAVFIASNVLGTTAFRASSIMQTATKLSNTRLTPKPFKPSVPPRAQLVKCPVGYTAIDSRCVRNQIPIPPRAELVRCPQYYTASKGQCVRNSCPSGQILSKGSCLPPPRPSPPSPPPPPPPPPSPRPNGGCLKPGGSPCACSGIPSNNQYYLTSFTDTDCTCGKCNRYGAYFAADKQR